LRLPGRISAGAAELLPGIPHALEIGAEQLHPGLQVTLAISREGLLELNPSEPDIIFGLSDWVVFFLEAGQQLILRVPPR
jgi:hypothetical protein